MFVKVLVILVATVLTAAALLEVRQERLTLSHDAARMHRLLNQRQEELWRLQSEIAARCRPQDVRLSLKGQEDAWTTIPQAAPPTPADVRVAGAARPQPAGLGG